MNAQVDRLQALLQRVNDNRQKPRAVAPAPVAAAGPTARMMAGPKASAAPQAPGAARPAPAAMPTKPQMVPGSSAADARPKPKAPTPLELAVEGRISQPLAQPPVRPGAVVSRAPAPAPAPAAVAAARPVYEGSMVADVAPAEPSKPIAHVVSTHPPFTALSFGELLRRSLSLRPR
jgi:hypothetical protein